MHLQEELWVQLIFLSLLLNRTLSQVMIENTAVSSETPTKSSPAFTSVKVFFVVAEQYM
jgi:hypothetical protein